jgi:hypothetical protein
MPDVSAIRSKPAPYFLSLSQIKYFGFVFVKVKGALPHFDIGGEFVWPGVEAGVAG